MHQKYNPLYLLIDTGVSKTNMQGAHWEIWGLCPGYGRKEVFSNPEMGKIEVL